MNNATQAAKLYVEKLKADAFQRLGTPVYSKVPEPLPAAYDFVSWVDDVCRAFSYLLRDLRACTARLARSWGILAPLSPDANAPLRHVVRDDTCDMP